jgi:hypothetical protein
MNYENVKVITLLNGQIIISQIEEVGTELGEPDCKLINPFLIKKSVDESVYMVPWLSDYTSQNTLMVHSDKILTIIEPKDSILQKYVSLNKNEST